MKAIADCLTQTGISYPLVQLRTLFQNFLGLSQGFFGDERNMQLLTGPLDAASYPRNSISVSWDHQSFNEFVFNGAESFSGMLGMSDGEFPLLYGDSV